MASVNCGLLCIFLDETVGQFFRERLPVEIVEQLTLDLPELVEGSFVPDALSLFISDKLFRVKIAQGGPAFVHVLTEHKSYPDRKVAWQITRGIMACIEQSIRDRLRLCSQQRQDDQ